MVCIDSPATLFVRQHANPAHSGECAEHFGVILEKFPPQVSSRSAAAAWGCHVHNEVNKSLHKDLFDCSQIGDFYDCGCADAEDEQGGTDAAEHRRNTRVGDSAASLPPKLAHEGLQRGG